MGYTITHHLLAGCAGEREETKTEKRKVQEETPSGLYQMGRRSEWEERAFFFSIVCRRKMRVGIQSKGDALTERYSARHAA